MKYQVLWLPISEAELAAVWLASSNRKAVTKAAAWLDSRLSRAPRSLGESRESSVHRVAFRNPIGIEFEIVEDDKRVVVQGVFEMH